MKKPASVRPGSSSGPKLCPAQQSAFEGLRRGMELGSILRLCGGVGRGKTTLLRQLHAHTGGAFLNMRDLVEQSRRNHPMALEESFYQTVMGALRRHPLAIVDDFHLFDIAHTGCHFYPRGDYLNSVVMGLCTYALEAGKQFVFGTTQHLSNAASERCYSFSIDRFKVEDYALMAVTLQGKMQLDALHEPAYKKLDDTHAFIRYPGNPPARLRRS